MEVPFAEIPDENRLPIITFLQEGYSLYAISNWLSTNELPTEKTAARFSTFYKILSEFLVTLAVGGPSAQLSRVENCVFKYPGSLECVWLLSLMTMVDTVRDEYRQTKNLNLRRLVDLILEMYTKLGEEELKTKVLAVTPEIFQSIIHKAFKLPEAKEGGSVADVGGSAKP